MRSGAINASSSSSNSLLISSGDVDIFASGDLDDYFTLSVTSNRPLFSATGNYLVLGKDATSGHSLDADDVLFGEDVEVDGMAWLDGGATIGTSVNVLDDILFTLGTTLDQVFLNRSATLTADTALTGVLIGTPDTTALAANSLIISNITADGDILIAANDGGHSKQVLFADGSTGITHLGKPGTATYVSATGDCLMGGSLEIDGTLYSTGNSYLLGTLSLGSDRAIYTFNDDAKYITFNARETGVGWLEVARFVGAADPYWAMGGSQQNKFYNSGRAELRSIVSFGAEADVTIATGVIAVTKTYHSVVVEGGVGAGADALTSATGGSEGDILVLKCNTTGANDQVTVTDGTGAGTFILAGGANFVLDHVDDRIMLINNGTEWAEMFRSSNS